MGVVTQSQGPPPAGQTYGRIQSLAYDSAGRVQQVTNLAAPNSSTGAYTRYVFGPNYVQIFSSVNVVADDAYSIAYFDGAGRTIQTAHNNPSSQGGFSAQTLIYDVMGRKVKSSNPAEINSGWSPTGDDASGWIYAQQSYDWKGRPLVATHVDGIQTSVSYSGCGCAGGQVETATDEIGRQQRVTQDILGRIVKTEILNTGGNSTYSATTGSYDTLDQYVT
jgi:hypothetical protein